MGFYEQIPDWAGPAPASVSQIAGLKRTAGRVQAKLGQIPPDSITFAQLSAGAIASIHDSVGPLYGGVGGEPGGGPDKALYVRTDDGDGGASTGLWQYESGAWVRVGVPAKHASQHATGGSDPITPANIGAVASTDSFTKALTANMTAITASTTLQNITGLNLTISSSSTEMWFVEYWIRVSAANVTMDNKFGFTVPTSCTMSGGPINGAASAPSFGGWSNVVNTVTPPAQVIQTGTPDFGSANVTNGIYMAFHVFGGGTGGDVQIQYAQRVSDPGALQILKGSHMVVRKLAS